MAFSIQTNVNSLIAQENLRVNSNFQGQTIQRLTSGYRINSSGDDAAGLAIANRFRSDTAELSQGVRNANDGISQLQIVDGGMNNVSKMLDRLRTLATQSASATFTDAGRVVANSEFQSLLTEIDRQAQAIGLDTGGQFAKSLSVFIGGGKAAGSGANSTVNGGVTVDLTASAVDTKSLGLMGMQAVAGSADLSGTSSTSVSKIVNDATNKLSESTSGSAIFSFSGSGFADSSKVAVSVNLSGVTDTRSLVAAINAGIQNAGNGATPAATAFRNAGITASVHTDAKGAQQIAFTSSNSAFQVQAGDQMSNAIMGNFSTGATGASMKTAVTGRAASADSTTMAANVLVKISGAGMASPVVLTLDHTTAGTVGLMVTSLGTQVGASDALKTAGITVTQTAGHIVFTNSSNEQFSVETAGDTANALGLGAFASSGTTDTAYTSIAAGATYAAAATSVLAGGEATMEFSINGGASVGIAGVSLAGGNAVAANQKLAAINSPVKIITGTNDVLTFSVDGHAVTATLSAQGSAAQAVATTAKFAPAAGAAAFALGEGNNTFLVSVDGGGPKKVTLASTNAVSAIGSAHFAAGTAVIATGTSDTFMLTVDAGSATRVTIAAGTYNKTTIVGAVQQGINNAGLLATASLDSAGNLLIRSNSALASSKIVIAVDASSTALGAGILDLAAGTSNGTAAYDNTNIVTRLTTAFTSAGVSASATATVDGTTGALKITSGTSGVASQVSIGADGASTALGSLGLTAGTAFGADGSDVNSIATQIQSAIDTSIASGTLQGTGSSATVTVTAGNQIVITNDQKGAAHLVSALTGNAVTAVSGNWANAAVQSLGTNRDGASMADAINLELKANAALAAAGLTASYDSGTGKLSMTSSNLTSFRMNAGAATAVGTITGTVDLTQGADFSSAPRTLNVSVDGKAATTVTLNQNYADASTLAAAINSQLTAAGAAANAVSINGKNYVQITSASGPAKSVQVQSTGNANAMLGLTDTTKQTGSNQVDLGFGVSNTTAAGSLALAKADSSLSVVNASGTSQTGALSFAALTSAVGKTQSLTFAANDAGGVMQSVTITLAATGSGTAALANDGSGNNIDQAVSYINKQLQSTNNPTLQKIVAVKQSVGGDEQVTFMSSMSSFQVGVGSTSGKQGLNAGVAETASGVQTGAGSTVSVLSQADAMAAVNAVALAVTNLGTAQAAVGKGQNQLNYAIGLANSQISNFSAAESRIRDADVASEAANLTKAQVLQQVSMAAMAQANSAPQAVMALLRG